MTAMSVEEIWGLGFVGTRAVQPCTNKSLSANVHVN